MKHRRPKFTTGFRVMRGNSRSQAAEMVIAPGVRGEALVKNRRYKLVPGSLILIEHGERHEIRNSGRTLLRTLNFYVPPAYTKRGDELPRGRR